MRIMRLTFVVLLSLALSASGLTPGRAAERYLDEVFPEVAVTTDIAYGEAVNDRGETQTLLLDLYTPSGDDRAERPVIVWAHGGSGTGGDKADSMDVQISTMLARRGWVVASINYRLMSGTYQGPYIHDFVSAIGVRVYQNLREAAHDQLAAVRWFRANASELRVSTEDIAVAGHSYGGGMAAYASFASDEPGDSGHPDHSSEVRAAFIQSSTILEPTTIGPGDPPVVMMHAMNDGDQTYYLGTALTCVPTRAMGNTCEQHVWQDGGHQLTKHRAAVVDAAAWFLCRHAVTGCLAD